MKIVSDVKLNLENNYKDVNYLKVKPINSVQLSCYCNFVIINDLNLRKCPLSTLSIFFTFC